MSTPSRVKLASTCIDSAHLHSGPFYRNVVKVSRLITARQSQQTFGFKLECVPFPCAPGAR